jgi:hypothetical protein
MPTLLKITFLNPNGTSETSQKKAWERSQQIAVFPGLIWKIWIAEVEQSLYGGIYLFEDESSAQEYLNSSIVQSIKSIPGASNFEAQCFEVNDRLSRVTRGPISAFCRTHDEMEE